MKKILVVGLLIAATLESMDSEIKGMGAATRALTAAAGLPPQIDATKKALTSMKEGSPNATPPKPPFKVMLAELKAAPQEEKAAKAGQVLGSPALGAYKVANLFKTIGNEIVAELLDTNKETKPAAKKIKKITGEFSGLAEALVEIAVALGFNDPRPPTTKPALAEDEAWF